MQSTKKSLCYWKGRAADARQAVEQAKMHLTEMRKCARYAARKVAHIERHILVALLLLVLVAGCHTVRGACKDGSWLVHRAGDGLQVLAGNQDPNE